MRPLRTAVLIIGLFYPLVIQAQPFGDTEITVFDADFLPAPPGPDPEFPLEALAPEWIALLPEPAVLPDFLPPIPLPELPS